MSVVVGLAAAGGAAFWYGVRPGYRPDAPRLFERARLACKAAEGAYQARKLGPAGEFGRKALGRSTTCSGTGRTSGGTCASERVARQLLASVEADLLEPNRAVRELKGAIDDWAMLLGGDQTIVEDRVRMGQVLYQLGVMYVELGRWDEAEATLDRGRALCEAPAARTAGDRRIDHQWVEFLNQHALLLVARGRPAEAVDCCTSAVRVQNMVVVAHGKRVEDCARLVRLFVDQGEAFAAWSRPEMAVASFREASLAAERLSAGTPMTRRFRTSWCQP